MAKPMRLLNSASATGQAALVEIVSPFNSWNPFIVKRNLDYAAQAARHSASLGYATRVPH